MRNTSPVGWRVTRYDYINRQLYNGVDGLAYLNANPPDLWLSADQGLATVGARAPSTLGQYFDCSFIPQLSTDSWTFDIMYRQDSTTLPGFICGMGAASPSSEIGFCIGCSTAGSIFINVCGANSTLASISTTTRVTGVWEHIVAVVNKTSSTLSLYLNSSLYASTDISGHGSMSGIAYFVFGYARKTTSYTALKLNGSLSRARLTIGYPYSQSDVDVSYNNGNGLLWAEMPSSLQSLVSHAWNLNEASGPALNCVSTYHGIESGTGASTTIGSTNGPRESIVADNSGNDYHLALTNYTASQKVTHWVTDSDGSEGLRFERASGHFCQGTTNHAFAGSTLGFITGSIGIKFKWQGTTLNTYEGLFSFASQNMSVFIWSKDKRIRCYMQNGSSESTAAYGFSAVNSIIQNSTSWQTAFITFDGLSSTSRYPRVYIDGVDQTVLILGSTAFQPIYLNTSIPEIGRVYLASTNTFEGVIDKVQVWNVALQSSDAVAFHNGSTPATAPVMDYTFNDGPQESGVSNGDSIAGWMSKEGNNYQFNQGTLAKRPSWVANVNAGQPGIDFDGTNDWLVNYTRVLSGDANLMYIVLKPDIVTSQRLYCQTQSDTNMQYVFNGISAAGYPVVSRKQNTTDVAQVIGSSYTCTTAYQLFKFICNSTITRVKINGYVDSYQNLGVAPDLGKGFGYSSANNSSIGSILLNSTESVPFNGKISELIAYDNLPTADNMLAIEKYLLTKYGIST